MFAPLNRRGFVASALSAGTLASLGDFAFLQQLPAVSAADAKLKSDMVRLNPDIEPLVRLIEETPREKLLEAAAAQVHAGTSYQQLLSAVLLAGVRGIKPRPVGFQFHAVLVIHSAHLASQAAPDTDRWLPLFWALDNFKSSQATNLAKANGWVMPAVQESKLPAADQARKQFIEAMDNWDEEGADQAAAALVRSTGAAEVGELLWRYGARDFRDIGHKAIYVANAWRTLQTIGWRHAEPVVRSLAFALLKNDGSNPAKGNAEPDQPWRENLKRVAKIRAGWSRGRVTPTAGAEVLATLRAASWEQSCDKLVEMLNKETDPATIWDGLFLTSGEWLMRQPGLIGIHCVTTTNALHFAYETSGNDETRRMLMLQAAAFLVLFRRRMFGENKLGAERQITTLEKLNLDACCGPEAIEEIFADLTKDPMKAARKTLAWLDQKDNTPQELLTAARRLIFMKGRDSHDYKFSSAALEDFYHVTPQWRGRYLATSMFNLPGTGRPDNDLIRRARSALAKS